MPFQALHSWDVSPVEAMRIQSALRERLLLAWDERPVERVAGVDMSLLGGKAHAAIAVLSFPGLQLIEQVTADAPLNFPYVPGLLAFREGPAILRAWEKIAGPPPDVVLFDGQGIAHPRGVGIAAMIGLWLQLPTIGVAKSRLFGRHAEPGPERGDWAELRHPRTREVIGAVLRTRSCTKPLYVSPGHLMDVPQAVQFTLACTGRFRLPETTRWAHRLAAGANDRELLE